MLTRESTIDHATMSQCTQSALGAQVETKRGSVHRAGGSAHREMTGWSGCISASGVTLS